MNLLFVCMGNICRSPTAEGVMRHRLQQLGLVERITVDSAGTHNYHPGKPPDARTQKHAALRGYDLAPLRARQIVEADFERFDLILTMDWDNQALTESICPPAHARKVRRLAEFFQRHSDTVVPDPYYGGPDDFERVLDLVEDAAEGLIAHCRQRLGLA
ncbi:MAG: low molecular weight phosphotyrosine protein phosphatase [Comamonadaceae bacterium]|jgi:protein-tyrosine phosphatase|nr:low molecular weight phosphotyrosine protein phosphatase [Comamonadaceae bacterium]